MKNRPIFVAGNWKMNNRRQSALALAAALVERVGTVAEVMIAVAPPFPYLLAVHEALEQSRIALGAQDVYFQKDGAFTGEVSTGMLSDCGCSYVIVGHSERRHVLGETDESVNRKVKAVLDGSLKPILCVGELLAERDANKTMYVVANQLRYGLVGVPPEQLRQITIAYEPVWAIGTGRVATPEQAEEVHAHIRTVLTQLYGADLAQAICIQYGGSVTPENADGLMAKPNVDGVLVGGASLKADAFAEIIRAGVRATA